jgi:transposase-like protein
MVNCGTCGATCVWTNNPAAEGYAWKCSHCGRWVNVRGRRPAQERAVNQGLADLLEQRKRARHAAS